MVNQAIQIFARLKPTKAKKGVSMVIGLDLGVRQVRLPNCC